MRTGLSGTMCFPTGRPIPDRARKDAAADRAATPFPPKIRDPTLLNLPAIASALDARFFSQPFPSLMQ
jgi:hypothetical protein